MKLEELITKVRDQHLDKDQLDSYFTELCNLKSNLHLELAELKKEKAMFMVKREGSVSIASRKEEWDATPRGQRKFEIESYISSVASLKDSIKSRLYNTY